MSILCVTLTADEVKHLQEGRTVLKNIRGQIVEVSLLAEKPDSEKAVVDMANPGRGIS